MVDSVNNKTNNTNSTNSTKDSSTANKKDSKSDISKNEFLQLYITQLKYQDPLNPTNSADFGAQLAQYSSLEQLTNLNDKLSELVETNYYLTQSVYNTMTTNLIGNDAKVSTDKIVYNGQDSISLGFNLSGTPTSTTIKIYNSAGKLVRTISDKSFSAGDNKLSWDFTDNDGKALAKGTYSYTVEAKGTNDTTLTTKTFLYGTVGSVRYTEDGTKVVIDGVEYSISDVLEIVNPKDDDGENTGGK